MQTPAHTRKLIGPATSAAVPKTPQRYLFEVGLRKIARHFIIRFLLSDAASFASGRCCAPMRRYRELRPAE